jgi:hypothetical protein
MAHPLGSLRSPLPKPQRRQVASNNQVILEPAQAILESAKEMIMAGIRKYKLSDALLQLRCKAGGGQGGKPVPTHETAAEQVREAQESGEARGAVASSRERMVDIGRGDQQAGRQGQ